MTAQETQIAQAKTDYPRSADLLKRTPGTILINDTHFQDLATQLGVSLSLNPRQINFQPYFQDTERFKAAYARGMSKSEAKIGSLNLQTFYEVPISELVDAAKKSLSNLLSVLTVIYTQLSTNNIQAKLWLVEGMAQKMQSDEISEAEKNILTEKLTTGLKEIKSSLPNVKDGLDSLHKAYQELTPLIDSYLAKEEVTAPTLESNTPLQHLYLYKRDTANKYEEQIEIYNRLKKLQAA